jgi:hypothetical protein
LIDGPTRLRHANHGHIEVAAPSHPVKRGENLLVGEISRCAKEDQRVCRVPRHDNTSTGGAIDEEGAAVD